ncbi:MAG TPA: hypothetical protein VNZ54_01145 [bacterium]|jgi:hypothetical protein|nr:hypothetical protein [bacterium]
MSVLLASSHYLHAVGDGPLPDLDAAIREACREPYRRVDRFIQLALLGAARCVGERILDPTCALYLGSGVGPEGNNILVQEQICRDHLLPRPFNFVNTLGSAATFFVSKDRAMDGQGWWTSRRGASLEAVLELALNDLELGVCEQALVGIVEECPAPYEDHRKRVGAAPGQALAEGSHWLLLQGEPKAGAGKLELESLDAEAPLGQLRGLWRPGDALAFGQTVAAELRGALQAGLGVQAFGEDLPFHDSLAAARATAWLGQKQEGRLHIVCGGPLGGLRLSVSTVA